MDEKITDGQLLAYLDGEIIPEVEQALQASAELRARLERLRQEDSFFKQAFGGQTVLDDDMVDVATNQATPQQKLRVSAFLRRNPQARREMDALKKAAQIDQGGSKRLRLPQFLAIPIGAAATRNSRTMVEPKEQSYYAAELQAQVTITVSAPYQERWQITGRLKQENSPVTAMKVTLRSDQSHPRPRYTEADGFFTFQGLRAGTYQLKIYLPQGSLYIPDIVLDDE